MVDPKDKAKEQGSFLRIESPSFSLELEGDPHFILQSYDMIRGDILRRLTAIIRANQESTQQPSAPSAAPTSSVQEATISPRETPSSPRISESFRSGAIARPSASDIKARMAAGSKRTEVGRGASPRMPREDAPPNAQAPDMSSDALLKKKMTLASIPQLGEPVASATSTPPAQAKREGYVWVYITHEIYNKVYVAELSVFRASPLGAFISGERIKKVHIDHASMPAFRMLMGEGKTMWSELTGKGREQIQKQHKRLKKP